MPLVKRRAGDAIPQQRDVRVVIELALRRPGTCGPVGACQAARAGSSPHGGHSDIGIERSGHLLEHPQQPPGAAPRAQTAPADTPSQIGGHDRAPWRNGAEESLCAYPLQIVRDLFKDRVHACVRDVGHLSSRGGEHARASRNGEQRRPGQVARSVGCLAGQALPGEGARRPELGQVPARLEEPGDSGTQFIGNWRLSQRGHERRHRRDNHLLGCIRP